MNDSVIRDRLLELYDVCLDSGEIRHKRSRGVVKAGQIAGCIRPDGYRSISIDNKTYLAHRLIMLAANGEMPYMVDHFDGNKANNSLSNLRLCDHRINSCNTKLSSANKYNFAGIRYRESRDAFEAYWSDSCGRKHKYFSCKKFGGYEAAKIAASRYRKQMIDSLSACDMPYTDRHCRSA